MTAHVHAKLMAQYAQDATETDKPWERWEYKRPNTEEWMSLLYTHPSWFEHYEYRRKPQAININGLEWSHTLLDGKPVTYEEAEEAVAELGDGWRLPTRQELESILDLSRHDPAIDVEKFPDTIGGYYWTSTPCAWRNDSVWRVDFDLGAITNSLRSYYYCVRAVREQGGEDGE